MIILQEKITLSSALPYRTVSKLKNHHYRYEFTVSEDRYIVDLTLHTWRAGSYLINVTFFNATQSWEYDTEKYSVTPRQFLIDAGKVFSTVGKILIEFVKQRSDISGLMIEASTKDRSRFPLYLRFAKELGNEIGFKKVNAKLNDSNYEIFIEKEF